MSAAIESRRHLSKLRASLISPPAGSAVSLATANCPDAGPEQILETFYRVGASTGRILVSSRLPVHQPPGLYPRPRPGIDLHPAMARATFDLPSPVTTDYFTTLRYRNLAVHDEICFLKINRVLVENLFARTTVGSWFATRITVIEPNWPFAGSVPPRYRSWVTANCLAVA